MPPTAARFRPLRALLQEVLGAAYAVERELGGGGMSRVFVAEEVALRRRVVVKVLPPELAAGLDAERFRREIRLAAALQHPHVVPLYAAGAGAPGTDGAGVLYFTMPYLDGESLRERLRRAGGGLPLDEAVRVVREVADALAHAHARGVVHRDVKPDNVLMSGGHAVVTDFGVAAAVGTPVGTATDPAAGEAGGAAPNDWPPPGLAVGTPAYMAPEQAAGSPAADHRADVYALGVLAHELVAGRPPFAGRTPEELMAAQVAAEPAPLGTLRAGVPEPLARLVARCLAKDPAARPASAAEVRDALAALGAMTPAGEGGPRSADPRGEAPGRPARSRGGRVLRIVRTLLARSSTAGSLAGRPPGASRALGGDPAHR